MLASYVKAGLSDNRLLVGLGLGLAGAIFLWFATKSTGLADSRIWKVALRWAHLVTGAAWIGLLYWFAFKPRYATMIEPSGTELAALYRWSVLAATATGLALALANGYLLSTLTFGAAGGFLHPRDPILGVGLWLALAMAASVWFIVHPAQKRLADEVLTDAEREALVERIALSTRFAFVVSFPVLVAMAAPQTLFGN